MRYDLIRASGATRKIHDCAVNIGRDGELDAFDRRSIRCLRLERVRVEWMAVLGIMVTGFAATGKVRDGVEQHRIEEWFLKYRE